MSLSYIDILIRFQRKLDIEIERFSLPYFIPRSYLVKPTYEGKDYLPDKYK